MINSQFYQFNGYTPISSFAKLANMLEVIESSKKPRTRFITSVVTKSLTTSVCLSDIGYTPERITRQVRFERANKIAEKVFYKDKTETDSSQGAIIVNGKQIGAFYGGKTILNTNTRNKKAEQVTDLVLFGDNSTVSKKIEDNYLFTGKRR